jgi:hypothetical protein
MNCEIIRILNALPGDYTLPLEHKKAYDLIVSGSKLTYSKDLENSLRWLQYDGLSDFIKQDILNKYEAFFERNLNKIDDWYLLSGNSSMSEAFYERHIDKVDWEALSGNPSMSEAFYERNLDKVDWFHLSGNSNMSEAFYLRHINEVNWYNLSKNTCKLAINRELQRRLYQN